MKAEYIGLGLSLSPCRILIPTLVIILFSAHSLAEGAPIAERSDLEGIWTLEMEGAQVLMVVRQHDGELAGSCTGEDPVPWNGVMTGSVSKDRVEFLTHALRNGTIVSMKIAGEEADETITGSFVRTDCLGNVTFGNVIGFRINPDASEYEPAAITAPADLARVADGANATNAMSPEPIDDENAMEGETTETPNRADPGSGERRVLDVTTQRERVFFLGWAWKPDSEA